MASIENNLNTIAELTNPSVMVEAISQIENLEKQRKDLFEALDDVVKDLFYQIEAKHGPEVAFLYPSIVKAKEAMKKVIGDQ